jgi:IS30 family transposase
VGAGSTAGGKNDAAMSIWWCGWTNALIHGGEPALSLPIGQSAWTEHLRRTRAKRRSRHHTQKTDDHRRIRDAVSISERPATVEDRAVPAHWEGDLLCGSGGSQIATLVERQTRYVMLVKIASKDSESVVLLSPLSRWVKQFSREQRPRK